ncbi:heat shock protein HslJ [Aquimarina sp. MAR_2010_214]|uniref:META domain-containing protein n=1 Tax=Aquimarina sp. MAR_2010_214 TaxID=1250026 RepID=UPI000C7058C5|nr:META domain-containing protein [Aquimarina sp. MAR_2010_214]PKV52928.1 heat shock protein HslJ [Aquimarina sp. MAR_2010_214]
MKSLIIILFFVAFSNTNSCTNKNNTAVKSQEKENQVTKKTTFSVTRLNGKDVSDKKLHITFDQEKGSAYGHSGCNGFSSQYTIKKEAISFEFPIATKMYCGENSKLEKEFFKTLGEAKIRILKGDSLILKDSNNKELFLGVRSKE